jgi:hypothetical protein
MPIVQITSEQPSVRIYYSLAEATESARACPDDVFYDAASRALTCDESTGGRLRALAAPTDSELRDLLIVKLRGMAEAGVIGDASDAEEVDKTITWLACAPSAQYMLYALLPGPVDGDREFSGSCKPGCTVFEKIWNSNCC